LLFGFVHVRVSDWLLVILPSPILHSNTPLYHKVLRTRERALTFYSFVVFISDSHLNLSRSSRVHHMSIGFTIRYFKIKLYRKMQFESLCNSKTIIHDSILKVHYLMFVVYLLKFIIMYIFLFVLSVLIIFLKIHIDDFTICLWHLNSLYIL
jgi:hypothetical protein